MPILDWSAFPGKILTVCKCGFDTMAPVECTKWMISTWDCTFGHSYVYWASPLTKWTALVSVSSLWSFSGQFGLLFPGQLLTVCKCGFDTMAPVECTKWMTSTWDCTLGHSCAYWASPLTKWTTLVSVSSLWSFSGQFF